MVVVFWQRGHGSIQRGVVVECDAEGHFINVNLVDLGLRVIIPRDNVESVGFAKDLLSIPVLQIPVFVSDVCDPTSALHPTDPLVVECKHFGKT